MSSKIREIFFIDAILSVPLKTTAFPTYLITTNWTVTEQNVGRDVIKLLILSVKLFFCYESVINAYKQCSIHGDDKEVRQRFDGFPIMFESWKANFVASLVG